MSKRNQIGYSLVFWETLKEYNENTKFYEPTKNKRVEVSQMLSEELSDDEEVKSLLIEKLFAYKDDIKKMLMNGEYCDIPSYHKESLEKDQRIADLEAKLAEKELSIGMLNMHLTDKSLEVEKADGMFRDCEADRKFEQEKKNIALKRVSELTKKLTEKEEQIKMLEEHKFYADNIIQAYADKCKKHDQDKIELLKKVKDMADNICSSGILHFSDILAIVGTLISEIKGE